MSSDPSTSLQSDDFIKVAVRIRPPDLSIDPRSTKIVKAEDGNKALFQLAKGQHRTYVFDTVFDEHTTQEIIFSKVSKRIIEGCVDGYNGTVFAYGQTGSGKTFTMLGPGGDDVTDFSRERRGLIPRSLEFLFVLMQRKQQLAGDNLSFLCKCSFVELYQESFYDLLDPSSPKLVLREKIKEGVVIQGAQEITASSAVDALEILKTGWKNRRVASTAMNRESSRSHAVFILTLESQESEGGVSNRKVARLNLVDLAGSERQKDAQSSEIRLKEAGYINTSLTVLGRTINTLVENVKRNQKQWVPYRDSQLTWLLRDSLGGNARTCMVANVHPSVRCYGETMSTLTFAENAKKIRNRAVVNEDISGETVAVFQAEITRLKAQLKAAQETIHPRLSMSLHQTVLDQNNLHTPVDQVDPRTMDLLTVIHRLKTINERCIRHNKALNQLKEQKESQTMGLKMILKFRDGRIESLEKVIEEKGLNEQIKDVLTERVTHELSELRHQLQNEPEYAKFRCGLESEQKRINNESAETQSDVEKLLSQFSKLKENFEVHKPDTPSAENTIEIAKLKEQLDEAETTIEERDRELFRCREKHEQDMERMNKKLKQMDQSLKAGNLRRQLMTNIHQTTLQALTPPTKANRRRTLFTPGTGSTERVICDNPFTPRSSKLSLLRVHEEEDDIMDEQEPIELEDNDTILEEFNKLQKLNLDLETKLDEQESEKLRQDTEMNSLRSMLDEKEIQIGQMRKEGEIREKELCHQLASCQHQLLTAQNEAQASVKIIDDLKPKLADFESKCILVESLKFSMEEEHSNEIARLEDERCRIGIELTESRRDRDKFNEENNDLRFEITRLKAQVEFFDDQLQDWEDRYNEQKKKVDLYESQLKDPSSSDEDINRLKSELEDVKEECKILRTSVENKSNTVDHIMGINIEGVKRERQLKADLEQAESEAQLAKKEREGALKKLKSLNRENDRLNGELEEVTNQLKSAKNDTTEIEKVRSESLSVRENLESELKSVKKELETKSRKLDSLERRASTAENQLSKKENEIEKLENQLTKRQTLARRRTKMPNESDTIEQLEELRNQNVKWEKLVAEYESEGMDDNEKINDLSQQLENVKLENVNVEQWNAKSEAKLSKYETKIKELEETHEKDLLRFEAQIEILTKTKCSLEETQSELELKGEELKVANERMIHFETELENLKDTVVRLKLSEEGEFNAKEKYKSEVEALSEQLTALTEELTGVRKELNSQIEQNAKLVGHRNPNQRIQYVDKLREKIQNLEEENSKLKSIVSGEHGLSGAFSHSTNSLNSVSSEKENSRPTRRKK